MRGGSHSSDADDRWKNLRNVARELDIAVRPELTVNLKPISTPELGFEPTCDLLNRKIPFTALVCYNDIAAIGAMRAIRDYGQRVPEDISVVGFDDIQSAAFQIEHYDDSPASSPNGHAGCAHLAAKSSPGEYLSTHHASQAGTRDSRVHLPARWSRPSPEALVTGFRAP